MGIDISRLGPAAQKQILEKGMAELKKKSKYGNQKETRVMPNGKTRTFDSKREARRYDELALLLSTGKIRDLRLQRNFTLQEAYTTSDGERVQAIVYSADFTYEKPTAPDCNGEIHWIPVVEDSKGFRTKDYAIKWKLMNDRGYKVEEV